MTIDSSAAAQGDSHARRYPAVYEVTTARRWGYAAVGALLMAFAAFLALSFTTGVPADRSSGAVGAGVALLTAGLALWLLLVAFRPRLTLWPDRLEYRGVWLTRVVARADIRGSRRSSGLRQGGMLELREGRGRPLSISADLRRDDLSADWFAQVPDLDAAELAASRARLLADREPGEKANDVEERLLLANRVALGLNLVAAVLVMWSRFAPVGTFANAAISLAVPPLSLWACIQWHGLFRLAPMVGTPDVRPTLFPALLLPSVALIVDLPLLTNLQSWHALIVPAIAIGALAAALALKLEARRDNLAVRASVAAAVLASASAYAGAAGIAADVWLDAAARQPVRVSVTAVHGRLDRPWGGYLVGLGPAATPADWASVHVSRPDFAFLRVGDVACLSEHPGLLGIVWAELHRCDDTPDRLPDAAARHWLAHIARPASQRPPLAQQLVDGDWRSVDATLNGLQKRFEAGKVTDVELEQAFIPLYNVEPALDAPLTDWLTRAPDSYAAHLAMALHTERQIEWLSRGGFDERTSPGFNWQERTAFERDQLAAADKLSSRPVLSLMAEYRLAPGTQDEARHWVERAVAMDSDDLVMRREYLLRHPLCPCNGTTPDDPALRWLLETTTSQRVRDALSARRLLERGVDAGRTTRAIEFHTRALACHPYPQDAYEAHIDIAVTLIAQQRVDDAIGELKAAVATLPGNRHAHEMLGYAYELQGRKPEALVEFLVDAERGQSWAQMRAGSFMLTPEPGVPLDRRTGMRWMREAANDGEAQARDILRRHLEVMAEYPPTY